MSKINVYSSSASNAIKVFDANSTGLKPDNAILVTTGTEPSNAIQINVGEQKWSSIAVNFGGDSPVPPEPSLPPYTIRLKYKQGTTPTFSKGTGVLYDAEQNIWDLTYENSNWTNLLTMKSDLLEVIDGNTSNVTNMESMFDSCTSLTSVSLLDTSNVTNMNLMFLNCYSLTTVPLFDTSSVTSISNMLYNCVKVQYGALALYQQASTQANPPSNHYATFRNCGSNTETGAAELAQIPSDWK